MRLIDADKLAYTKVIKELYAVGINAPVVTFTEEYVSKLDIDHAPTVDINNLPKETNKND